MKKKDNAELPDLPKLKYERRYDRVEIDKNHIRFLVKWINTEEKRYILEDYLTKNGYNTIYLYGYTDIAKIFIKEFGTMESVQINVIDKREILLQNEINTIKLGENITEKNSIMIISYLDNNREDFVLFLDTIYPNISKKYIDELF